MTACKKCGAAIPEGDKRCPKCKTEVLDDLYIQRPTVATDEFLAEEIWDRKTAPKYLIYHFASGKFEEADQIDPAETDKKGRRILYVPVDNDALRKGLVIVPSGITETTFKEVFAEIDAFANRAYDACGQTAMLELLTRVTAGSWFLDRFVADQKFDVAGAGKFAPIIPIRGPSQSGKNRLAFVLRLLSYRPYFEMSTYRIPSLYRPLDLWRGTLVLDEADFANTNEKSELVHYLNCRATGTPLSRQNPKNPRITDTFSNFGLTIVTQRKAFDDNATESRALPFYSEPSDQHLPVIETDQMLQEGLELQNKLLFLRMKYYRDVVIEKDSWIDELSDHRLIASLLPLLALSKYEFALRKTITDTAKIMQKLKIEEKANSMDGLLVNYFWEKISDGLFVQWQPHAYYILESTHCEKEAKNKDGDDYEESEEDEEKLVTEPLTTSKLADHFKWSSHSIRKTIKSLNICAQGLPFRIKVGKKSYRVIFFEADRLEKRLREFVVDYTPKSLFEKVGVTGDKVVTVVTEVTLFMHTSKNEEAETGPVEENRHLRHLRHQTETEESAPDFLWREIPEAELCELCGKRPVEREINDIHHHEIVRRCVPCFERMKTQFLGSKWREML
ncbi:zinc ribbon domain-containing protein [Candidatus Bathyarchaeota archaeon]|nr:zinc ribbon domain-containing protein [Candidatus Bathyarchaeota archaeon]